jgi:hypothetical protein
LSFQQVHLRINEAATGQPTPVRLRITDAVGTYFAPYGRLTDFATGVNQNVGGNVQIGAKKWAYIDGTCEIMLPPGILHIEISKGPEYKPIDEAITLHAGKLSLRFTIERWSDMRKQGWHSGDTRVHFLSPDAVLLEGQAEDIAVVNLLAKETTVEDPFGKAQPAIPNILSFSGQSFARQSGACGVAVNTQNVHPELGSLGLLHCHRAVYPLQFGGPHGKDDWTLGDWCDQCHRKNGLVVWTNPQHQTEDFLYGEALAELVLGKVDAFELTFWEDSPFDALVDYYRLLEAELAVPLVGASGKESNGLPLGAMRTYAYVPASQEFSYRAWIEAVRAGRTFVSNGPLLHVTINGEVPSASWSFAGSTHPLRIRAEASSVFPFEHLELLWNGAIIENVLGSPSQTGVYRTALERELAIERSGWLAVRCRGDTPLPSRPAPQRVFAHTSPIAVRVPQSPGWAKADSVKRLVRELDAMLGWAKEKAHCDTPKQRERLCRVFEEARTTLAKKLSS